MFFFNGSITHLTILMVTFLEKERIEWRAKKLDFEYTLICVFDFGNLYVFKPDCVITFFFKYLKVGSKMKQMKLNVYLIGYLTTQKGTLLNDLKTHWFNCTSKDLPLRTKLTAIKKKNKKCPRNFKLYSVVILLGVDENV